ncbi:hypothetical protein ACIP5Y_20380 [Nocardia sp. NPDC088792]|uniref:hypothetical protein n=1 Tax=Nocardia sp. NPDC088792 TaxID=3364332 RepID=UPI00382E75D5
MSRSGIVCTPLRSERATLWGAVAAPVVRTGRGPKHRPSWPDSTPIAVVGVAGALNHTLRPGDLVVAQEIRSAATVLPSPAGLLLHSALRRRGLRTTLGPVYSAEHVIDGPDRARLAETGAIAVDTESAFLATDAPTGQTAVVRAIVDTPAAPLLRPGTPWRGVLALRALRSAAVVLDEWSAAVGEHEVIFGESVPDLTGRTDLVLVLGASGNPERRPAEVAAAEGVRVHAIDSVAALELRLLRGVRRIGIVTDAAAPPLLAEELMNALSGLGPVQVSAVTVTDVHNRIDPPREVS